MPTLNILVAEDNGTYRKLFCAMIERVAGCVPDAVENGEEACKRIMENHYDVVFMDNHMPKMDGIEATRFVQRNLSESRRPRIIAVTGSSNPSDLRQFEIAGADGLLSKPFGMADLAGTIQRVVSAKAVA